MMAASPSPAAQMSCRSLAAASDLTWATIAVVPCVSVFPQRRGVRG